jgi:hypothetical protein
MLFKIAQSGTGSGGGGLQGICPEAAGLECGV